jgi:hypothetical protein
LIVRHADSSLTEGISDKLVFLLVLYSVGSN